MEGEVESGEEVGSADEDEVVVLREAADAEVAGLAEDAVGGADDEFEGGRSEGIMPESGAVELAEEEVAQNGVNTPGQATIYRKLKRYKIDPRKIALGAAYQGAANALID